VAYREVLIAVGASFALGTPHPELPGYIQLRAVAEFEREAARIVIPARRAERRLSQGAALDDGRQRSQRVAVLETGRSSRRAGRVLSGRSRRLAAGPVGSSVQLRQLLADPLDEPTLEPDDLDVLTAARRRLDPAALDPAEIFDERGKRLPRAAFRYRIVQRGASAGPRGVCDQVRTSGSAAPPRGRRPAPVPGTPMRGEWRTRLQYYFQPWSDRRGRHMDSRSVVTTTSAAADRCRRRRARFLWRSGLPRGLPRGRPGIGRRGLDESWTTLLSVAPLEVGSPDRLRSAAQR